MSNITVCKKKTLRFFFIISPKMSNKPEKHKKNTKWGLPNMVILGFFEVFGVEHPPPPISSSELICNNNYTETEIQ